MANPFYAMDTCFFHSLGAYPLEARCAMLSELGYDGTYLTLWNERAWQDLPRLGEVAAAHGLTVPAVYGTLDVAADEDDEANRRLVRMLTELAGCDTLELAIRSSDKTLAPSNAAADEAAGPWLGRMLNVAAQRDITIALYPHLNFWLERVDDAVRLCRRIGHANLKAVFPAYHWYAVDRQDLPGRIEAIKPYLHRVNLCGSRLNPKGSPTPATIEPLDTGELDNFALLGLLRRAGYEGPIGLQGYSSGGDVYTKLRRSLEAYHDMHRRLDAHPEWADLDWA